MKGGPKTVPGDAGDAVCCHQDKEKRTACYTNLEKIVKHFRLGM